MGPYLEFFPSYNFLNFCVQSPFTVSTHLFVPTLAYVCVYVVVLNVVTKLFCNIQCENYVLVGLYLLKLYLTSLKHSPLSFSSPTYLY